MAVNIMIYESRAVITHRGLFNYDPVRWFAGTKRRVLLRHAALRIHRGISDFQQAPILRIRILIGVDGWFGIGPWGKEFNSISLHNFPASCCSISATVGNCACISIGISLVINELTPIGLWISRKAYSTSRRSLSLHKIKPMLGWSPSVRSRSSTAD